MALVLGYIMAVTKRLVLAFKLIDSVPNPISFSDDNGQGC